MLRVLRRMLRSVSDREDLNSLPPEVRSVFGAAIVIAQSKTKPVQPTANRYLRKLRLVEREYREEYLNQHPTATYSE